MVHIEEEKIKLTNVNVKKVLIINIEKTDKPSDCKINCINLPLVFVYTNTQSKSAPLSSLNYLQLISKIFSFILTYNFFLSCLV
jgi:hypothetical protein